MRQLDDGVLVRVPLALPLPQGIDRSLIDTWNKSAKCKDTGTLALWTYKNLHGVAAVGGVYQPDRNTVEIDFNRDFNRLCSFQDPVRFNTELWSESSPY